MSVTHIKTIQNKIKSVPKWSILHMTYPPQAIVWYSIHHNSYIVQSTFGTPPGNVAEFVGEVGCEAESKRVLELGGTG